MKQDRWQQVKSTVAVAIDMSEADREKWIDSACGTDTELRREVESLLAAADAAQSLPEARNAITSAASSLLSIEDESLRSLLESALGNQYEIIRAIGRGGMGWVYLAREKSLERFVAIKVLRPELAIAGGHRERFRREARIAARLNHPGILGLHSFGAIGNLWDRVVAGQVTDFLHFYIGTHVWPDFNVADSCIVVGAILLMLEIVFAKETVREHPVTGGQ